jgi:prepilin-type N-terminal cleavage/methylation domain-containing protein
MGREDGFTLVELLVGTAIMLIVMSTALSTFQGALLINDSATLVSDANQNLRAAINLVARDLMQAGRGIPIGGVPIPSGVGSAPILRPGPSGSSYTFDNVSSGTLPALIPGPELGPVIDGRITDLVTILVADPTLGTLTLNPAPAVAGQATLAADGASLDVGTSTWISDPQVGVQVGDVIMFSNALGDTIQEVTDVTDTEVLFGASDPLNLNQRGAAQGSITQIATGGAYPQTTATRVQLITYYVDDTSSTIPRLVRRINNGAAQALAGVIEDLEFSYDLVDGNTNPVNVKEPTSPDTPNQIRKVNLHVGVRSDRRSERLGDYLRQHVTTVVSVRSLAFVNRYE